MLTYLVFKGESEGGFNLKEMSKDLDIPENELEKRLKPLTQSALVNRHYTIKGDVYSATLSTKQLLFGLYYGQDMTEKQIINELKKIASRK